MRAGFVPEDEPNVFILRFLGRPVHLPTGTPRTRARVPPEIAKVGRTADVFLPEAFIAKPIGTLFR